MPQEKSQEETYSLIFTSLKHPIRRRILRMLISQPLTFSEILQVLSIDSGHLSYHLESLGELVARSDDGKYVLSAFGQAAVKLMSGVEEQPLRLRSDESKLMLDVVNVYALILVAALALASLYFVNFSQRVSSVDGHTWPGTPILLSANEVFEANFTLVYTAGTEVHVWQDYGFYYERKPPINTPTTWEMGWFGIDLESNETYEALITSYSPEGEIGSSREDNEVTSVIIISPRIEITQAGLYRFEIKNIGERDIRGLVRFVEEWDLFEKPYFYYGAAGIVVALVYPVVILVQLLRRWKSKVRDASLSR